MSSRKRNRLEVRDDRGWPMVGLRGMEIWDGADLALLRESLTDLIEAKRHTEVAVDLAGVKYIPSGFFGMLFEWYEDGVTIRLVSPQPNVERMLWFRMFFQHDAEDCFLLTDEAVRNHTPNQQVEYHKQTFMNAGDEISDEEIEQFRFGARQAQSM